jgi:hypothetical protein
MLTYKYDIFCDSKYVFGHLDNRQLHIYRDINNDEVQFSNKFNSI